jgi:hypothetical protein
MSYVGGTIAAERSFSFLATCNRTQINNCTHKKYLALITVVNLIQPKKKENFYQRSAWEQTYSVLRLLASLVDSRRVNTVEPRDPGTTHPFQFQNSRRRNVARRRRRLRGWARAHMERARGAAAAPQPTRSDAAGRSWAPLGRKHVPQPAAAGGVDGSQSGAALNEKPSADLVPCRTREPPSTTGVVWCNPTPPRQGYHYFRAFCCFSFGLCLSSEPTFFFLSVWSISNSHCKRLSISL